MKPISARKLAANRANLAKAGPLTDAGRERIRQAVLRSTPWQQSTGPRTPEGKSRCRMNALKHGRDTAAARDFRRIAMRFLTLNQRLRQHFATGCIGTDFCREAREMVGLSHQLTAFE